MTEGVYELHWQRREFGILGLQLYARLENGQLTYVDSFDQGPFDTTADLVVWLVRSFKRDGEALSA